MMMATKVVAIVLGFCNALVVPVGSAAPQFEAPLGDPGNGTARYGKTSR